MSKDALDDMIKKALEKVEQEQRKPDWDEFSHELHAGKLNDFDRSLKNHLEELSFHSPNAWDRFEDKLADVTDTPHTVDHAVRDHLHEHEAAYSENSWMKLSALLDLTEVRERRILIQKLGELSIFTILIFFVIPLALPEKSQDQHPLPEEQLYAQGQQTLFEENQKEVAHTLVAPSSASAKEITHKDEKLDFAERQKTVLTKTIPPLAHEPWDSFNSGQSNINNPSISSEKGTAHLTNERSRRSLKSLPQILPSVALHMPLGDTEELRFLTPTALPELNGQSFNLATFDRPIDALQPIAFKDIDLLEPEMSLQPSLVKAAPGRGHTSLAIFAAPLIHLVSTPYDEVYQVREHNQVKPGIALGLEVEHTKGKASYGGSFQYQELAYTPPLVTEVYGGTLEEGYQAVRLEQIQLSMASLSIFARQHYAFNRKLSFFAHFGGGINMALNAQYDISEGILTANGAIIPQNLQDFTPPSEGNKQPDLLLKKEFHQGLLEGGGYNENSYMSIEIGAGINYQLNTNTHLFASAISNLSPFRDGIGPNRDKIQNISLRLGCKYYM